MPEGAIWVVLGGMLTLSTPLLLACMGGLLSERSGVINIGLEGKMLTAACVTAIVGLATQNAFAGLGAGIAAACLMALLHAVLTQAYRIDHIVSGMAINAISLGATSFLSGRFIDDSSNQTLATLPIWAFEAAALLAPIGLWLVLRNTRYGLRLFAVGEDPVKSRQMGVEPVRLRYASLLATGALCGLSGAMIANNSGRFTDNMTAGRGFIALAALILGGWRPIPAAIACLGFGLLEATQLQLQGSDLLGANVPSQVWNALPYLATLIALAGIVGRSRAPAGLGVE